MNSSEFPNSQYNIEYYDVQPLIIASFCTHRIIFKLTEYLTTNFRSAIISKTHLLALNAGECYQRFRFYLSLFYHYYLSLLFIIAFSSVYIDFI